jgi:uncharacterized glyoxalase superfamily protein PhnB
MEGARVLGCVLSPGAPPAASRVTAAVAFAAVGADPHPELQVGDSRIMVNDAMGGGRSARAFGGSPISMWLYVKDCDALQPTHA